MKKIILFGIIIASVLTFCSCGKKLEDDGKALLTADSTINVTSKFGVITINKSVALTMLSVFGSEHLGLKNDIYDYELELSATTVYGKSGCLIEAYADNETNPEGIFAIIDHECYVYKNNQYMLLTLEGPVEVTTTTSIENQQTAEVTGDIVTIQPETVLVTKENGETEIQTQQPTVAQTTDPIIPGFKYSIENDKELKKKFSAYSQEELGLSKDLNEFILVTLGASAIAEDGETVYIVNVFEKDGSKTPIKFAFSEKGCYKFNSEINRYQKF